MNVPLCCYYFVTIVGITVSCSQECMAQSIWARHTGDRAFLFFDTRARSVGDIVTVVVAQATNVDSREDRVMDKETGATGLLGFNFQTGGGLGTQSADATIDGIASSSREFDGRSNYRSEQDFTDRIAATVIEVLPNGNLVLAGRRDVIVAGEAKTLILSGVIRPIDLNTDNSVNSRFIADFSLSYEGGGPSQAFTRQGWLGRKLNHYWPF